MKTVIFTDRDGFVHQAVVRDNDGPDVAEFGLPAGPPDIRQLDWENLARTMNNALAAEGLWTWDDVQRHPVGVRVASNLFKRALIELYRLEHIERRERIKAASEA